MGKTTYKNGKTTSNLRRHGVIRNSRAKKVHGQTGPTLQPRKTPNSSSHHDDMSTPSYFEKLTPHVVL